MTQEKDTRFHDDVNFRDLGGYPTKDGRHVKKGIFYRSGGIYRMNKKEIERFKTLGIRSVLDLRTEEESLKLPNPPLPGIHLIRHSGVVAKGGEEIDFSPRGMDATGEQGEKQLKALTNYYCNMPFENEAFHIMMDEIDQNEVPICFHCATGKDRTGVAAMLILLLLGVDEETVFEDYMLSAVYKKKLLEHTMEKNKDRVANDPILKELLTMKDSVSPVIGRKVLESIKEKYGTYENYFLQEYGYDATKIESFRKRYLD